MSERPPETEEPETEEPETETYECSECTDTAECTELPDSWATINSSVYCPDCYFACCACGDSFARINSTYCQDRDYCESCHDDHHATCSGCDECMSREHLVCDENRDLICVDCRAESCKKLPDTTFDINKSRRACGFELEYIIPESTSASLSSWGNTKCDGSIHTDDEDYRPEEFASHIMAGDKLLSGIYTICDTLHAAKAKVNKSCGFHLHLNVKSMNRVERNNVSAWFQAFESFFYAMCSPSRRTNTYCAPVAGKMSWSCDRYHSLNTSAYDKFGTFEVRLHSGTIDATKVRMWAMLFLAFFDTLSQVYASPERIAQVNGMSDRGKLIFLFQQLELPMSIRKYMVKRINKHNHGLVNLEVACAA